jgi:hypothetical protein
VARVIGSAMWNNPEALNAVQGTDLVTKLVDMLRNEDAAGVQSSLVYALSASATGEYGVREFINANGSQALREIFIKEEAEAQRKCAMFVEDNMIPNRAVAGVDSELKEWCRLLQHHLLNKPANLASEKVLSSLM